MTASIDCIVYRVIPTFSWTWLLVTVCSCMAKGHLQEGMLLQIIAVLRLSPSELSICRGLLLCLLQCISFATSPRRQYIHVTSAVVFDCVAGDSLLEYCYSQLSVTCVAVRRCSLPVCSAGHQGILGLYTMPVAKLSGYLSCYKILQ